MNDPVGHNPSQSCGTPLRVEQQIDQLCDQLEARLREGAPLRLEECLQAISPAGHPQLLEEVARLIREYRPQPEESVQPHGAPDTDRNIEDVTERGPEPHDSSDVPRRMGAYRVIERIGAGGMGVVYQAWHEGLQRHVALKVLPLGRFVHHADLRERLLNRFQREVIAASQLHHPHIVSVYEVGEDRGQPYFAMQYVAGPTLARLITNGGLTSDEIARHLASVARAVHALHQVGVIHRDLKPSNILIESETERALVADFGLAKLASDQAFVTRSGEFFGTPAYMAPEQIEDAAGASVEADIYSLGATMYCALTGRPPFLDSGAAGVLHQVIHQDPAAPRVLNPGVPRDLESICLKAIEKDPRARYVTAAALADDLERFLSGQTVLARPSSWHSKALRWAKRNPLPAALIALVALTLTAGLSMTSALYWRATRAAATERTARLETRRQSSSQARLNARLSGNSPAGLLYLVEAMRQGNGDSRSDFFDRIRFAERLQRCGLPRIVGFHDRGINSVVSNGGGELLTASDDGTVKVWSLDHSRDEVVFKQGAPVTHAVFADQGRVVAATSVDGFLRVWSLLTRALIQTDQVPALIRRVAVSPDGKQLATASYDGQARVYDLGASKPRLTLPSDSAVINCAFIGSNQLATLTAEGELRLWNLATADVLTTLRGASNIHCFCVAPDEARLLAGEVNGTLGLWDIALGKPAVTFDGNHRDTVTDVCYESSGKMAASCGADGWVRLWDAERGKLRHEFQLPGRVSKVGFSADGDRLAAICDTSDVYCWETASGKLAHGPLAHAGTPNALCFLPDHRTIATGGVDQAVRLWTPPSESVVHFGRAGALRTECASDQSNRRLLCADQNGLVSVYDSTGKVVTELRVPKQVVCARFGTDQESLVTACLDGSVSHWNLADASEATTMQGRAGILGLAMLSGHRLVTIGTEELAIWDLDSGRQLNCVATQQPIECWAHASAHDSVAVASGNVIELCHFTSATPTVRKIHGKGRVTSVGLDQNGERLVAGFDDGSFLIYFSQDRSTLVRDGVGAVTVTQIAPDGTKAFIGRQNGEAQLVSLATPDRLLHLIHDAAIISADLRDNPHAVIVLTEAGRLTCWDCETGELVWTEFATLPEPDLVRFWPSNLHLLEGSPDGVLSIRSLRSINNPLAELSVVAQMVSARHYSPSDGASPLRPEQIRRLAEVYSGFEVAW